MSHNRVGKRDWGAPLLTAVSPGGVRKSRPSSVVKSRQRGWGLGSGGGGAWSGEQGARGGACGL